MDLKALKDTPPWDWPTGTRKLLLDILRDDQSSEPDRLLATELAGDFTVISDDVAEALLSILRRSDLKVVGSFGHGGHEGGAFGHLTTMALDSKNNIYVGETMEGKRVQRFLFKGMGAATQ